jgi:CPA2 family monovalent cation:H+ antiporter-2
MNTLFVSVLLFSIVMVSSQYLLPLVNKENPGILLKAGMALVTLLAMLPFLWALVLRNPSEVYKRIASDRLYQRALSIIRIIKLCLGAFFIGFLLTRFFSVTIGLGVTLIIVLILVALSDKIEAFYKRVEARFILNFNQRELAEAKSNRVELAPWDAHMVPLTIEPDASSVGQTLMELKWREKAGINVVLIKRGETQVPLPEKTERIYPGDQVLVLGTDIQIKKLQALIRPRLNKSSNLKSSEISLQFYTIRENNPLIGKTIRQSGIKEKAQSLIVGIERKGERLLNPESDTRFMDGDVVFVVGDRSRLGKIFD